MKKKIITIALLLFNFHLAISQCNVTATNFGNNTTANYDVTGDVTVTLNSDNTLTLDLGTNFATANGPDIRAYLVNSNGLTDTQLQNTLIENLVNFELGLVGCGFGFCSPSISASGAKSFTVGVPDGQDISDYDKVFFYCLEFDQFWDFGSFTPFTSDNCNLLSVNDNDFRNNYNLYPNPTTNTINIQNINQNPVSISVYNILGKEILKTKESKLKDLKINLSSLRSGVYLLKASSNNSISTTRFIKQ